LILNPDLPFLKLFKRFLTAEIGKKLEIDKDEVEDILNKKDSESK
jgi:energy-converting hydrogenase A subunit M